MLTCVVLYHRYTTKLTLNHDLVLSMHKGVSGLLKEKAERTF